MALNETVAKRVKSSINAWANEQKAAKSPVVFSKPWYLMKWRALAACNLPAKTSGHEHLGEQTSMEREITWMGYIWQRVVQRETEIEDCESIRRVQFNTCLLEHCGC